MLEGMSHRFLRIFGDVRVGEGRRVGLFGLQIFLLLTAYYLLKTVREPLILLWGIWGLQGDELQAFTRRRRRRCSCWACCRSTARWRPACTAWRWCALP